MSSSSTLYEWLIAPIRFILWPFFLIYRGYYHPLAKFPGPRLAGMTKWYEFYYDVVCKGQFVFKVQEMHRKYGPIVRITPDEIHIEDTSFYDRLYSDSEPRDKSAWMAGRFGAPDALPVTTSHTLHLERRTALAPLFSVSSIQALEPLLWSFADELCARIAEYAKPGKILPLQKAWVAYAGDVATEAMVAHSYGHIRSNDFEEALDESLQAAGESGPLILQFPWIKAMLDALPDKLVGIMEPRVKKLLALQSDLKKRATVEVDGHPAKTAHATIFSQLLSSNLDQRELTANRIWQEAQTAIGFAIPAPSWALTVTSYHIIANPHISARLRTDLTAAIPDAKGHLAVSQLMQLPYLRACIQEGLRLSYGTSTRLPRMDPENPIVYRNFVIPPGTPVSMTNVDIHHDESIFPDSHAFKPERWLDAENLDGTTSLDRYMVAFGGGSRRCLGIHLAHAEVYVGIAAVFRRFWFGLFETDDSDVVLKHDFFSPTPKLDSKGLRVKIEKIL